MNKILEVKNLCKRYENFSLKNVSFFAEAGKITGFIGRNGAGKTTTLKSILNLADIDFGEIKYFGLDFRTHEQEIKQQIGFAFGAVHYYNRKRIKDIANVTKNFYPDWDNNEYKKYLKKFNLDENKKIIELSEGMKVKLSIAFALSHKAKLLILDEPTSGLDPVSRNEILEIFLELVKRGISIIFSSHITSDLDKCADNIIYIRNGEIFACENTENFINSYRIINADKPLNNMQEKAVIGKCNSKAGKTVLIKNKDSKLFENFSAEKPDLQEIMVHIEQQNEKDEKQ